MRVWLALGCTACLLVVAACNRGEEGAAGPDNESVPTANQAATADSAPVDAATVLHDRHERYEEIGDAMKGISRELKADAPSMETVQRHAALIARYAPQVPSWFPPGTGPEAGRTRAKAEIWTDNETFRQRAEAFRVEAERFNQAAQTGNADAVRAALPRLGETCKNCHDRFRAPERD